MIQAPASIEIGSPATMTIGSDRYAATVIAYDLKAGVVTVRNDKVTAGEGHDYFGQQVWEFEPNPKGSTHQFRLDRTGLWRAVWMNPQTGRWNKSDAGYRLTLGVRAHYSDPHF